MDRGPNAAGAPAALSALRTAIGETLPPGGVGVVAAPRGIGKTALLVQIGLEALLRGRRVLHVACSDTVDHARTHYDELLRALPSVSGDAAVRVERGRMIHSFAGRPFTLDLVARNLDVLAESAQFAPDLVLVDGYGDADALEAALPALRALGLAPQVEVWATVEAEGHVPAVDRVVRLVPEGRGVQLLAPTGEPLALDPVTFLVVGRDDVSPAREAPPIAARDVTLFSGGAAGAEAAFGEASERFGATEVNLTFDGHLQARTRGRYVLTPTELALGDVSLAYVSKRLNRTYNDQGGLIRGVLQTLWHMVSRSEQVFVIGKIQADGTVVGGTGWSVELARMWSRDLWVYDQEKGGWFRWEEAGWAGGVPRITANRICGTGTRYLDADGKQAIDALFSRSFS